MTRKDPDVNALPPTGWRSLTGKEIYRLKIGEKIDVTTNDGIEERIFEGFSETGLLKTRHPWEGIRITSLIGGHRAVVYAPQMEEMHEISGYNF